MATVRKQILQALVDKLGAIPAVSAAGGAQKVARDSNTLASLPAILVSIPSETREDTSHAYRSGLLRCSIDCFAVDDGTGPFDDQVEDLLELVEGVLLTEADAEPILGLASAQMLTVEGHTKFAVDEANLIGVAVDVVVRYRHDPADPTQYTGVGA